MRAVGAILALLSFVLQPAAVAAAGDPADLRVTKGDEPDPVRAGTLLLYVIRVTNDGPDPAADVTLSDTLPADVVFHDVTASQGTCSETAPEIVCDLGALAVGSTATVRIWIVPTRQGTMTNTATAAAATPDPDPSDNTVAEATTVAGPSCTRVGTAGDDRLSGTPASDVLCGAGGEDVLIPGAGSDVVLGGPGVDRVSYADSGSGVVVDLAAGTAAGSGSDRLVGIEGAVGSAHDDVLRGSAARNRLIGGGRTDILLGRGARDVLSGRAGGDYLHGGKARDVLNGGKGTDVCVSGARRSCYPKSPPDGNDTRGILDVRRVRTDLGPRRPTWTVVTRSRWTLDRLWDDGFVLVYLDTAGGTDPEYYALARSVGSGMRGELFRHRDGIDQRVGAVRVRHPGRRSVLIRVPLGSLEFEGGRAYYRWSVQTILLNGPCSQGCFDRVPGGGMLPQPRGAA